MKVIVEWWRSGGKVMVSDGVTAELGGGVGCGHSLAVMVV